MNETLNVIKNRFSCRSFTDKAVSKSDLTAIAEAGIEAPSGMNRQPWQIIALSNKKLLAELEAEGISQMEKMPDKTLYNRIMSRGGKLFYNASSMIVIAIKEVSPKGAEQVDLGIAAQNMVIAATSLGIDSCHLGLIALSFAGSKAAEFKQKLKFPNGYECGMAILLGYAKDKVAPHTPDKTKITVIE